MDQQHGRTCKDGRGGLILITKSVDSGMHTAPKATASVESGLIHPF